MTHKTLRTILAITLAATLLFSVAYAYSSADEQDFLSFFFDEQQADALQNYQNTYTANEFLALKIRGKLPALPDPTAAVSEPEVIPAPVIEIEQPVLEDGQLIAEDKTLSEAVVFDSAERA